MKSPGQMVVVFAARTTDVRRTEELSVDLVEEPYLMISPESPRIHFIFRTSWDNIILGHEGDII